MAWIESHDGIVKHPKVFELSTELSIDKATAVGLLHLLWHFTIQYAWKTGDLSKFSKESICDFMGWEGDADTLFQALNVCGWMDDMKVHDWDEYTLHYNLMMESQERRKEQTRERVKRWRETHVTQKNTLRDGYSNANVTPCNAATLPNLTKPKDISSVSENQKHEPAIPIEPPLMVFPTKGNTKTWPLTKEVFYGLKEAFPGVDVLAECNKALGWSKLNPVKQKTARGMGKFLFSWIERSNNSWRNGNSVEHANPKKVIL